MVLKEIEQIFIGSLIMSPKKMVDAVESVKIESLTDTMAINVYSEMTRQFKAGEVVDVSSIILAVKGSALYMAEATGKGSTLLVGEYGNRINKLAKDRRINKTLSGVLDGNLSPDEKLEEVLDLYQSELLQDKKGYGIVDVMSRFDNHVRLNKTRGSMGIKTGIRFLDDLYIEYVPGHIWTMGAFTSVGKTAMMIQKICRLIAVHEDVSIVIISTEMTEQQVTARILSNFTGVHSHRILSGNYRQGEEEVVENYKTLLKTRRITICDNVYNKGDIEAVFRRLHLQGGVDVGFIDYVQNCKVPDAKSEYQAGADLAKGLQKLAKDVECCLICLSQVSNDVGRGNTSQFELKGAGEWAAVSDVGVQLMRDADKETALRYLVKKNRHGAKAETEFEYLNGFTSLQCVSDEYRYDSK